MDARLSQKHDELLRILTAMGRVAVAFSGGVDSALLLCAAHEALGSDVLAVTIQSRAVPEREVQATREYCASIGVEQVVLDIDELAIEGFAENPPNRCYLCKKSLFASVKDAAAAWGASFVADGSNKDDEGDYRPGMLALEELEVRSPLREAGLTKPEVRALARDLGVPMWNKPSAACLASRFAYGERITEDGLRSVEQAEALLGDLGFSPVRVRVHGPVARIELAPDQIAKAAADDTRETIAIALKAAGFTYVSLDLTGYRSGSMNAVL